jgi:hypothetical protein
MIAASNNNTSAFSVLDVNITNTSGSSGHQRRGRAFDPCPLYLLGFPVFRVSACVAILAQALNGKLLNACPLAGKPLICFFI